MGEEGDELPLSELMNRRMAMSIAGKVVVSGVTAALVSGAASYYAGSLAAPIKIVPGAERTVTQIVTVPPRTETVTVTSTVTSPARTVATTFITPSDEIMIMRLVYGDKEYKVYSRSCRARDGICVSRTFTLLPEDSVAVPVKANDVVGIKLPRSASSIGVTAVDRNRRSHEVKVSNMAFRAELEPGYYNLEIEVDYGSLILTYSRGIDVLSS